MELDQKILKELKRLGIDYDLNQKNNFEDFPHIDFSKLPKCYEQILFSVKWPDKQYYIMEDDLEDGEVDFDNFDFDDEEQWECIKWHQIEFWEHPVGAEHSSTRPKEENNYGDQIYQQIGNVHDNYVIFLNLSNICTDGDPEIHVVFPYEPEGENVYLETKLSEFLHQLVELKDINDSEKLQVENFEEFTKEKAVNWIKDNGGRVEETSDVLKVNLGFTDFKNFEVLKFLPDIEHLNISSTKVDEFILYKNLLSLKTLSLYELNLKSISFLKELNYLKELTLPANEMDFNLLNDLGELKELYVSHSNKNYYQLEKFSYLETLSLYGCSLENVDFLENFSELKVLNLFGTGIDSIESLSNLKNLEDLNLMYTKCRDFGALKNLTKLNRLVLNSTKINDSSIFENLKNLKELSVSHTALTKKDIDIIQSFLPDCRISHSHHEKPKLRRLR